MEQVVREAQQKGVTRIWLRASADGRQLYTDMGFAPSNFLQFGSGRDRDGA